MEYYPAIKKRKNPAIFNCMGTPGNHHIKWNKPEKYKYCMISNTYKTHYVKNRK